MVKVLMITLQYPQHQIMKLNGCYNDGDEFKKSLIKAEKLNNSNFIWMRDDLNKNDPLFPKRRNILLQLRKIILQGHKKIFFYFSGHGYSRVDYNRDELKLTNSLDSQELVKINASNRDSCLVTNEYNRASLILDDELFRYLTLLKRSQKFYGFTDCCHSGTMFDLTYVNAVKYDGDFNSISSNSPLDKRLTLAKQKCSLVSSHYPKKINKLAGEVYLISGCRDKQYSYESYQNGKVRGHFTYNLCKILDSSQIENYSMKDIVYLTTSLINNKSQVPVCSSSESKDLDEVKPWKAVKPPPHLYYRMKYGRYWWLILLLRRRRRRRRR